jgi:hypothetical protein
MAVVMGMALLLLPDFTRVMTQSSSSSSDGLLPEVDRFILQHKNPVLLSVPAATPKENFAKDTTKSFQISQTQHSSSTLSLSLSLSLIRIPNPSWIRTLSRFQTSKEDEENQPIRAKNQKQEKPKEHTHGSHDYVVLVSTQKPRKLFCSLTPLFFFYHSKHKKDSEFKTTHYPTYKQVESKQKETQRREEKKPHTLTQNKLAHTHTQNKLAQFPNFQQAKT